MRFIILGAGGVGCYIGARLLNAGEDVKFIARGAHLKALKNDGLSLSHPNFTFSKKIDAMSFEELKGMDFSIFDAIILCTKSIETEKIAKKLSDILKSSSQLPYIISLQNGVENENILCEFFPQDKVIGGIARKIGAHVVHPGKVEATGNVEIIAGAIKNTVDNSKFLSRLSISYNANGIIFEISSEIKKELWKKLIINNGVNALCTLLRIKTGVLMHDEKLSRIVFGLMSETVQAAKYLDINFLDTELNSMFDLIKNFDSIKPSMLVDREFNRRLELDDICGVVIKYNTAQGYDATYTRTVSTLLEFVYKNE